MTTSRLNRTPPEYVRPSRSLALVDPYTLCRWCGLVRVTEGDTCPPHLRSDWEWDLWNEEARMLLRTAKARRSA